MLVIKEEDLPICAKLSPSLDFQPGIIVVYFIALCTDVIYAIIFGCSISALCFDILEHHYRHYILVAGACEHLNEIS